jgi:3-deoxy-D-manno-octulosonic-acid transferase
MAIACGAAMQVANTDELVRQLNLLLLDAIRLAKLGQAGLKFVKDNQGATEYAATLIDGALKNTLPS